MHFIPMSRRPPPTGNTIPLEGPRNLSAWHPGPAAWKETVPLVPAQVSRAPLSGFSQKHWQECGQWIGEEKKEVEGTC